VVSIITVEVRDEHVGVEHDHARQSSRSVVR
jgi:hypothetical protein